MIYKLRTIVSSKSTSNTVPKKVMGLTIPNEVAVFFEGCHFNIEKSGTCIVAYSGTSINPIQKEVKNFDFSEIRI